MNPVSFDIKDLLVAEGIGVFAANTGWSISIAVEPVDPDTVITIYDVTGTLDYNLDGSVNPIQHYNNQIRVRAEDYQVGYNKALEISQFLDKKERFDETAGTYDVHYALIQRTSDIISLGEDDNDRFIFVVNFKTTRRESDI